MSSQELWQRLFVTKFDRYFLNQLVVSFLFFSFVLIAVFWVNKAVILFDRLISEGHSARIFIEFSILTLPDAAVLVFPISSFTAAIYVTNRLSNESEFTIMRSAGMGASRLGRPVSIFGLIIVIIMLAVTNYIIPISKKQLNIREHEIGANLSAKFLREGRFLHPMQSATIFIENITSEGELKNIFISDRRDPNKTRTYTAQSAYLLQHQKGTKLVMLNGLTQIYDIQENSLSTTTFANLAFDVGQYFEQMPEPKPTVAGFSTWTMFYNSENILSETGSSVGHFVENLHQRFHQPLLCLLTALIGFSAVAGAEYSRKASVWHIILAIFLLVLIKIVEGSLKDFLYKEPTNWPLVYVPSLFALICFLGLIWNADRSFIRQREKPSKKEISLYGLSL